MTDYLNKYATPTFRKFQEGGAAPPPPGGGDEAAQIGQALQQIGAGIASGEIPPDLGKVGLMAMQQAAEGGGGGGAPAGPPPTAKQGARVFRQGGAVTVGTTRAKLIPRKK